MTENRVWDAVANGLLGRSQRTSHTGFVNICCPMCVTRGESADRKYRCGVRFDGSLIGVNCFNCAFRAVFQPGQRLSQGMRGFLANLGTAKRDVALLGLWAEQQCQQTGAMLVQHPSSISAAPGYATIAMPEGAQPLETWAIQGCTNPWFYRVLTYLQSRGDEALDATTYYWTPTSKQTLHRRLLIPCYQDHRLVGWTGRAVDPAITPRYLKELPSNFLFNLEFLSRPKRKYVLIVEGVIDALVIDGIGALGASLNEQQIAWINQSGKQPVVVPDRDAAGGRLIEIAIQQGWLVACLHYGRHQWWDTDIKDAADAVQRYGKLYTIQSILATVESHPGLIRLRTSYSYTG